MNPAIEAFNEAQATVEERQICETLAATICELLPEAESKIWHRHPVWFLDGNPTVGYSKLKAGIRLMFWSGASFDEDKLQPGTGKFKDASMIFTHHDQIELTDGEPRLLFVDHGTAQDHFGASVFWMRQMAAIGGEQAAIEDWQIIRDGAERGIVEITAERS